MTRNRLSPSRRREDIRAWWAEHVAAQRRSGQTQAAYCRAQGLNPKYFTLWKGKLQATAVASAPRMVPVVVAPAAQLPVSGMPETASTAAVMSLVSLRLSLGNGMSLALEIGSRRAACGGAGALEASMLKLPPDTRVFMAVAPVDMRRSFSGLCAIITETLGANPIGGDLFLFRGKRSDRVKAIMWDRTGLAIWYKRLERGKYKWPSPDAVSMELTEQELALLLDGVDFTRIRRLPPFVLHAPRE